MSTPVNPLAKLKLELQTNILLGPRGMRGLPGDKGDPGSFTTIEIGATETLPYGSNAYVNAEEVSNGRVFLTFGIPEGPVGDGQGNVFAPPSAAENNVVTFGADRKQIKDSGVALNSLVRKTGAFQAGRIPVVDADGNISDSTKVLANIVSGPAAAGTNYVALFADPTGKNLKSSGIVLGDAAVKNTGQVAGTVAAGDDYRFQDIGRNDSAFALEFADIRGQRFGMRGGFSDNFKLLDGVIMPNGGAGPECISLLHFDGPTGKRVVEDQGYRDVTHNRPRNMWTMMGTAQLSDAQKKFGETSLYVDSSSGCYLAGTGSQDFAIAAGQDFDLSMWVYRNAINVNQIIYEGRSTATQLAPYLDILPTNKVRYYVNGADRLTSTSIVPVNTWTHIRVARKAGVTRLFINGVSEGGTWADNSALLNAHAAGPQIGGSNLSPTGGLNGYIDEFRFSKTVDSLDDFVPPDAPYGAGTSLMKGQLYDAIGALFKPRFAGELYLSLVGTRAGSAVATTRTDRNIIPASFIKKMGNRIALRFRSWSAQCKEISNCFIGHKAATGNVWDMDPATITRVTFNNGQNSLLQPVGLTVTTLSDWIVFPMDPTRDLIISMEYANAASAVIEYGVTNTLVTAATKASALEAAVAAPTGFTVSTTLGACFFVDAIFGRTDSKEYQDMWIDGAPVEAAAPPSVIRGAVQFTAPDITALPNTDFAMDVSRDDGENWVPVELFLTQIINNIYTFEGLADMSAVPTGTTIKYRTRNPGGKYMPVSGVVVQGK